MVLLGYNHLTTIATTDALAPLHLPKPTATYVTLTGFFYLGWHGGCWWYGSCLLHNAEIAWSMNAGSSQDDVS